MVTRTRPRPSASDALPGEARVLEAAQASLSGERRGLRAIWPFLGPAFIAAVAYVDPATSPPTSPPARKYGYMLLWVILGRNIMAMIIQSMSAKLGIATGHEPARGVPRAVLAPRPRSGSGCRPR